MSLSYNTVILFLNAIMVYGFVLLFYGKLTDNKTPLIGVIGISLSKILFMTLFANLIIEPFRTFLGVLLLAFLLKIVHKRLEIASLLLPIFITQLIWPIAVVAAGVIAFQIFVFSDRNSLIALLLMTTLEMIIYTILLESKRIEKLKPVLTVKEIKRSMILLTSILIIIFSFLRALADNLNYLFHPIIFLFILGVMILIAIVLIFNLTAEIKGYRDKEGLQKQVDDLTSLTHSYKSGVRLITFLIKELNHHIAQDGMLIESGNISNLPKLISNFDSLTSTLGIEVAHEEVTRYINCLDIPNERWELKLTLAIFLWQAHNQNISFEVKNELIDWEKMNISGLELSQLIENFVSNSLKELSKTEILGKFVVVRFYKNESGHITIEIADNAHEFPLEIISKLGQRKNSTNGTGDGYAEIFTILKRNRISLLIEEASILDQRHKKVVVIFDKKKRMNIQSNYRQEKINMVLQ